MFEKQSQAGVAWLDAHYGREIWLKRIDIDRLAMGSYDNCILGQLEGDFEEAISDDDEDKSGILSWEEAKECGFVLAWEDVQDRGYTYPILDQEWKATITALRS